MACKANMKMFKDYFKKASTLSSHLIVMGLPIDGVSQSQKQELKTFILSTGFKVVKMSSELVAAERI